MIDDGHKQLDLPRAPAVVLARSAEDRLDGEYLTLSPSVSNERGHIIVLASDSSAIAQDTRELDRVAQMKRVRMPRSEELLPPEIKPINRHERRKQAAQNRRRW